MALMSIHRLETDPKDSSNGSCGSHTLTKAVTQVDNRRNEDHSSRTLTVRMTVRTVIQYYLYPLYVTASWYAAVRSVG